MAKQIRRQSRRKQLLLLFTGAGFSATAGAPVMRQFLTAATRLSDECLRRIRAGFYFTGYAMHEEPNLETAFGAMVFREIIRDSAWKVATTERDGTFVKSQFGPTIKQVIEAFERGIATLYAEPTHPVTRRKQWIDEYACFFRYLLENFRLGIITTNYDLVAEAILQTIRQPSSYYLEPEVACDSPVPILKLHGSVNWEWETRTTFNARTVRTDAAPVERAFVLPPTWNKDLAANGALGTVWRDAVNLIASAEIIFTIGQSFPPTDAHLDYLFAEGLTKSAGRPESKRLIVADPDLFTGSRICQRFLRYQTIGYACPHAVRFDQILPEIEKGTIRL